MDKLVVAGPAATARRSTSARRWASRRRRTADLTFAEATQLLASLRGAGRRRRRRRRCSPTPWRNRDQRQIGYYVLLASAGVNLDSDNIDVLDAHPHEPLAHYLSLHSSPTLRKHASRWAAASNVWGDGFLRRLGMGHALLPALVVGQGAGHHRRPAPRRARPGAGLRQAVQGHRPGLGAARA